MRITADGFFNEYNENIKYDPMHYSRRNYVRALMDRNDLPCWFSQVKGCGFRVPETKTIQMPLALWHEMFLQLDGVTEPFLEKLGRFVEANWNLADGNLDIDGKLFFRFAARTGSSA